MVIKFPWIHRAPRIPTLKTYAFKTRKGQCNGNTDNDKGNGRLQLLDFLPGGRGLETFAKETILHIYKEGYAEPLLWITPNVFPYSNQGTHFMVLPNLNTTDSRTWRISPSELENPTGQLLCKVMGETIQLFKRQFPFSEVHAGWNISPHPLLLSKNTEGIQTAPLVHGQVWTVNKYVNWINIALDLFKQKKVQDEIPESLSALINGHEANKVWATRLKEVLEHKQSILFNQNFSLNSSTHGLEFIFEDNIELILKHPDFFTVFLKPLVNEANYLNQQITEHFYGREAIENLKRIFSLIEQNNVQELQAAVTQYKQNPLPSRVNIDTRAPIFLQDLMQLVGTLIKEGGPGFSVVLGSKSLRLIPEIFNGGGAVAEASSHMKLARSKIPVSFHQFRKWQQMNQKLVEKMIANFSNSSYLYKAVSPA